MVWKGGVYWSSVINYGTDEGIVGVEECLGVASSEASLDATE